MARNKIRTSTGWLVRETIKGLPEAGEKVGKVIGREIGKSMKLPFGFLKKAGKGIRYFLGGGKYGEMMNERVERSKERMKKIKKERGLKK